LHTRLHAAGIDIKASKNTAIAAMITELPGPVVANALNLHPSTTTAGPEASPHLADLRLPPNTMTM
ncbi:MAG TPA: hypothetical protein VGV93_11025, partial [Acidimicrobiales bacterium]|nr:hypothetical protein [Acidimicrobiales bacterium]